MQTNSRRTVRGAAPSVVSWSRLVGDAVPCGAVRRDIAVYFRRVLRGAAAEREVNCPISDGPLLGMVAISGVAVGEVAPTLIGDSAAGHAPVGAPDLTVQIGLGHLEVEVEVEVPPGAARTVHDGGVPVAPRDVAAVLGHWDIIAYTPEQMGAPCGALRVAERG